MDLTDVVLTGPRLMLRPWRPADADAVFAALREDVETHRFTTVPVPYEHAHAVDYTGAHAPRGRADGTELSCALEETSTGRLVGSASLRLPDGDIGYIVHRGHRGHGYAAEATRSLADWAFAHGYLRVGLKCDVRNLASARTALAAGLTFEGVSWQHTSTSSTGGTVTHDLARFARLFGDAGGRVAPAFAPLPADGLSDGVVRLRPMAPDDTDGMVATLDALAQRWSFHAEPPTRAAAERTCAQAGLDWLVGTAARMVIVDVATGAYAGDVVLRLPGPPQVGLLGYGVHPGFRGRGYTTRALELLVPWAFGAGGFARLELGAKVGNVASQRAAAAAGFEPDGVRRGRLRNPDGTFSDELRFALLSASIRTTSPAP